MMKVEGISGGGGAGAVNRSRRSVSVWRRGRWRWRAQQQAGYATPLRRLLAACRRAFRGPAGTAPAPDGVALVKGILDKIRPQDVHCLCADLRFFGARLTDAASDAPAPRKKNPTIGRITMYKCTNFSIEMFLLPPGAVIPLHNHPGMTVLSKLLLGSLHVKSYDWWPAGGGDPPLLAGAGGSASDDHPARRLARVVVDADLAAPCDALVLHPESGGNMHRLAAATACAVLDVLGPPYSGGRPLAARYSGCVF